jgi:uncharacterized small protein (DUF1192 family)
MPIDISLQKKRFGDGEVFVVKSEDREFKIQLQLDPSIIDTSDTRDNFVAHLIADVDCTDGKILFYGSFPAPNGIPRFEILPDPSIGKPKFGLIHAHRIPGHYDVDMAVEVAALSNLVSDACSRIVSKFPVEVARLLDESLKAISHKIHDRGCEAERTREDAREEIEQLESRIAALKEEIAESENDTKKYDDIRQKYDAFVARLADSESGAEPQSP